ncbi:helix-turn-helix transcriptional regulator [Cohnella terricola]|uniref:YafY family transcriptional regulator n=1 Tax=Cohnella terricola TaxID=1289167 RepID=A0A559JWY9_9BACL|nr:YafY family protein [Cohnella terricola]TVY04408.1 YafY family transcriptional regulator [Cohnella terricola]
MKLDRLLSIVILLVNRRRVQAKELADRFEVSVRTIYRDIEAINQAGIPVVTFQGASGGIGLTEGYRLDRNVLTDDELIEIVNALQSVATIYPEGNGKNLLEKMNSIVPQAESERFRSRTRQFIVDFSPWGRRGTLEEKLELIKRAVEDEVEVSFTYCSADGKVTERSVEPYTLVLKKQTWYLYAYCLERRDFRLFKLIRMKEVKATGRAFARRCIDLESIPWNREWFAPEKTESVKLLFHPRAKHLAEEWFGAEHLIPEERGYVVSADFPEDRWLYGFILGFGPDAEVLEPERIREKIKQMALDVYRKYASPPQT